MFIWPITKAVGDHYLLPGALTACSVGAWTETDRKEFGTSKGGAGRDEGWGRWEKALEGGKGNRIGNRIECFLGIWIRNKVITSKTNAGKNILKVQKSSEKNVFQPNITEYIWFMFFLLKKKQKLVIKIKRKQTWYDDELEINPIKINKSCFCQQKKTTEIDSWI